MFVCFAKNVDGMYVEKKSETIGTARFPRLSLDGHA